MPSSPQGRLLVHGGVGLEEVGDVRDVDAHLHVAARQRPHVQRVVDVLASRRVHAADAQSAQILPADTMRALSKGIS